MVCVVNNQSFPSLPLSVYRTLLFLLSPRSLPSLWGSLQLARSFCPQFIGKDIKTKQSDLPKVTELINGRAGFHTHSTSAAPTLLLVVTCPKDVVLWLSLSFASGTLP